MTLIRGIAIAALLVISRATAQDGPSMVVHKMDVSCAVTSRFARTVITTEIWNTLNSSQEAVFDVELPKTAFISNFSMTIDGVTTAGVVKEKEKADEQYSRAVSLGESAGLVQSTGRKMENFKISVNVGARAAAIFTLTYEELLKRQHGNYELQIKVRPKQLVQKFQIAVNISEPQEITSLRARATFMTNDLEEAMKITQDGNRAHVVFRPSLDQQRKCPLCQETLLDGDFVLTYDVQRELSAGNIQIVNGYFVHYFAPSSLTRLPKNVVFVIDCSGSMSGRKIQQTLEAFTKILEDLPEDDSFGILKFSSEINSWKTNLVKAEAENIQSAKEYVKNIRAGGGTDINQALLSAAEMLKKDKMNKEIPVGVSFIIFLSDGDPTSGVTNTGTIRENVRAAMGTEATLYSLGFGSDLDYGFLEKLSLENGGLARRIYEDSDSALQLQDFYREVAFPVLRDVTLQYPDLQVNDLTQNSFRHYYQGSELIVAGRLEDNNIDTMAAQVTAQGVSEEFSMKVETNIKEDKEISRLQSFIFGDFTERLWAYLTVEQLLTKQISAEGDEKKKVTEEALRLSLKYGFVTPLTSMVITTSEEEDDKKKEVVAEKPKEGANRFDFKQDMQYARIAYKHSTAGSAGRPGSRQISSYGPIDDLLVGSAERPSNGRKSARRIVDPKVPSGPSEPLTSPVWNNDSSRWAALVSLPHVAQKLFLGIDGSWGSWINLLHIPAEGLILNGELAASGMGFTRLGLQRKTVKVDMTSDKIITFKRQKLQTFSWAGRVQGLGFLKKEGSTLSFRLGGLNLNVILPKNSSALFLNVESLKPDSTQSAGLIGQLMVKDKILVENDHITIDGTIYPAESSLGCDFSMFGVKTAGSCIKTTLKAGTKHDVSGLYGSPTNP